MLSVKGDKEKEEVTFSTTLMVDGNELYMWVTKLLGYFTPRQLGGYTLEGESCDGQTFEEAFYFSKELYTTPPKTKHQAHHTYQRFIDTNYNYVDGKRYEVQWKLSRKQLKNK